MDSEKVAEMKVRILEILKDYCANVKELEACAMEMFKLLRLP